MRNLVIRPLSTGDEALLIRATLDNLNWREDRFTEDDVRDRPEFWHYTRLDSDRGDFGFVAEIGGGAVGVGWALFLPGADPGYGFLDDSVPEVSLWVREDTRGEGVGRLLLERLQQEATARSLPRLSLSVEDGNDARRLYASLGFTPISGREADGVMVWEQ